MNKASRKRIISLSVVPLILMGTGVLNAENIQISSQTAPILGIVGMKKGTAQQQEPML